MEFIKNRDGLKSREIEGADSEGFTAKLESGFQDYAEDLRIQKEIEEILGKAYGRKKKRLRLIELKKSCRGETAKSRLSYHINALKNPWKKKIVKCLQDLFLCSIVMITILLLFRLYYGYINMLPDDRAVLQMVEDYEKGDDGSAQARLHMFIKEGMDGYLIYEYIAKSAIRKNGDYGTAIEALSFYLTNIYGIQNVTKDNQAYTRLIEILNELSESEKAGEFQEKRQNALKLIDEIIPYTEMYEKIGTKLMETRDSEDVEEQENEVRQESEVSERQRIAGEVLPDCENLKTRGADCFEFAALYVTALLDAGRYNEAADYVRDFVKRDNSYQEKSITIAEREALIRYILPWIDKNKAENFRESGFLPDGTYLGEEKGLLLHEGVQYAHDRHYAKDLQGNSREEFYLSECRRLLADKGIMSGLDTLNITNYPVIMRGREYCEVRLSHLDGGIEVFLDYYYDISTGEILRADDF